MDDARLDCLAAAMLGVLCPLLPCRHDAELQVTLSDGRALGCGNEIPAHDLRRERPQATFIPAPDAADCKHAVMLIDFDDGRDAPPKIRWFVSDITGRSDASGVTVIEYGFADSLQAGLWKRLIFLVCEHARHSGDAFRAGIAGACHHT